MDISTFQGLLEKGLGRAPLYLQEHDSSPYRDAILHACTHDLRFDRQLEACRGVYLMDLIRFSGDMPFYRSKILAALADPAEDESAEQMYQIARLLAEQGDQEARRVMYDTFERYVAQGDFTGAYDLIDLDGLDALLRIAGYLTGNSDNIDSIKFFQFLISHLEERDGEQATQQALAHAGEQHPEFIPLLEAVQAHEEELKRQRKRLGFRLTMDYVELKQLIFQQDRRARRFPLAGWGRRASEKEVAQAAADLLVEQDRTILLAYLHIFEKRPFPLDFQRLLTLASDTNEEIARAALNALTHIRHPEVRKLALDFLHEPDWGGHAIRILANNYQEGDYALLENLLEQPLDPDGYHYMESCACEFIEQNLTVEAERALILLYENGPCPFCRQLCVKSLMKLGRLPEWMRAECRYDADSDIREMVSQK